MDDEIERLIGEDRLLEAARLARARGDARTASRLFERACDWVAAAQEARRAGEPARALALAITGDDGPTAESALNDVLTDAETADRLAADLAGRSHYEWAARIWEALGRAQDAARAWARAGRAVRAAGLLEAEGDRLAAARILESALKRDPQAWPEASALGALLVRLGRYEAAIRTLQRIPPTSADRPTALRALSQAFERLGFRAAAAEIRSEREAHGATPPANPQPWARRAPLDAPPSSRSRSDETSRGPRTPTPLYALDGRYRVLREVGSSPSARVFECEDVNGGEHVAIKLFTSGPREAGQDAAARLERDLRALQSRSHPAVVPIRDVVARAPAVVLAWMDETLEDVLERGPLAPSRAAEIALAVLSALGEAHTLGILHRAVKPSNVLFDATGVARLSDFGSAHMADVSATASNDAFSSWAYLSPEQRRGRPTTPASDIYAVGLLLHRMVTGERPNTAAGPLTPPSQRHAALDARHDAVVDRFTATEPADRPSSALEARSSIASVVWPDAVDARQTLDADARTESRSPPPRRIETDAEGALVDAWTGRIVECVPLSDAILARARAFAAADHPGLQKVLRADMETHTLWLAKPPGRSLARPLTPRERGWLSEVLDALHATGIAHGRVAAEHIVLLERATELGPVLCFDPFGSPGATAEDDRRALAAL